MRYILAGLILFAVSQAVFGDAIGEFSARNAEAGEKLEKNLKELKGLSAAYAEKLGRVNSLKKETENRGGIAAAVKRLFLESRIRDLNTAAYKVQQAETRQRELEEEYFTYAFIVVEEYGRKLKECFAVRCGQARELYSARLRWIGIIGNYEPLLSEPPLPEEEIKRDPAYAAEYESYLERKGIQIRQRLILLEEEKDIRKQAALNGIKEAAGSLMDIEKRIASLKRGASEADERLKEVKMKLRHKTP